MSEAAVIQPRAEPFRGPRSALAALLHSHHGWFWSASVLVCLACYGDVVFAGRTFLPVGRTAGAYDVPPYAAGYDHPGTQRAEIDPGAEAWQVHPWAYEERRALLHGELPLWNRHSGLGHPLLANGQTATLNPLHWIVLLQPDEPALWDLYFLLLRFLPALFGCYLAAALGAPKELAVLAAPFGAVHGVFTIFLNRADLAAYAVLPAVLFFVVRLSKKPSLNGAIALAFAMALCLTGGHPEPAFACLFVSGLVAAGLCTIPGLSLRGYLAFLAVAGVVAGLISAPYWLPFLERVQQSWSLHEKGTYAASSRPPFVALQWLAPNAFGHGMRGLFDVPFQNYGFLGLVMGVIFLAGLVAILAVPGFWRRVVWLTGPLLLALRTFGAPFTGWLSRLPLLDRMPLDLYFTFAVLYCFGIAGICGLAALTEIPERRRRVALAFATLLALEVILLAPVYVPSAGAGLSPKWSRQVLLDCNLILAAGILCWASLRAQAGRMRRVPQGLLFLAVAIELVAYRLPLARRGNPTAVALYARWLQERQKHEPPFRVMGLGFTMMPNLATAFSLDDVRICDALLAPEYLEFLHRFLQPDLLWGWLFTATTDSGFRLDNPVLDWLNVRYLVAGNGMIAAWPTILETELLRTGHPGWENKPYLIDGTALPLLFEHPNDEGSAKVRVPAKYPVLSFALAQDPAIWNQPGDGVTYEVALSVADGAPITLFSENIDAKMNVAHRHWMRARVDLSRWRGKKVTLILRARSENTAGDWGGWGDLHWESLLGARRPGDAEPPTKSRPIAYSADPPVKILENPHAWPRVFATAHPLPETSRDRVLDRIGRLASVPGGPYAVVGPDFPAREWAALCPQPACEAGAEVQLRAGELHYGSNSLSYDVVLDRPGVLVTSDLLVPGWSGAVDGRPQDIFRVNHLFRGLLVPAGTHRVSFRYWPRAWTVSFALAALGWAPILTAAVMALWRRGRAARFTPAPVAADGASAAPSPGGIDPNLARPRAPMAADRSGTP